MIEIKIEESDKICNLYNTIKNTILSKKDNPSFKYEHEQHHLYEEREYPGISKGYYNEYGHVEFENTNGQIIRLEINRWHPHMHNGCSGLNGNPCLVAGIYMLDNEEKIELWKLNVKSGTLYFKAEVSSLDIPYEILQEKQVLVEEEPQEEIEEIVEELPIPEMKPLETRILFEEINNLYNQYKIMEQKKEKLLSQRQKKIEEMTEKIMKSYSQKIDKNNEDITASKKELNDFNLLFMKYSTFYIDLVGNTLQQLISIIESEEYLYTKVIHQFKKRIHGVVDSWYEDMETTVKMVVKQDQLMDSYDSSYQTESKIDDLVKNGDALVLSEQDIHNDDNKKITFYTSQDGQVICHVDFGKFDYIKEFIDSIIQYRFQNDIVEFTEKDMLSFMSTFIMEHQDSIVENYGLKLKDKYWD